MKTRVKKHALDNNYWEKRMREMHELVKNAILEHKRKWEAAINRLPETSPAKDMFKTRVDGLQETLKTGKLNEHAFSAIASAIRKKKQGNRCVD